MITTAAREGKKKISPYMPQEGIAGMAYHWTVVFMVTLTVNYLVIPFQVSEQTADGRRPHSCFHFQLVHSIHFTSFAVR